MILYNKLYRIYRKFRMSYRKRLFILVGKQYYIKTIHKLKLLIDMKNRVDRQVDIFSYESLQIDYLFSKLENKQCSYFIDIGSHWGYYSLLIAKNKHFDMTQIHAFEPDKINRYQLYANLFLNNMQDRINVYEYALSKEDGELKFHHSTDRNRGMSNISEDGEVIVKTKKLDSILTIKNITAGIKIDTEGHELDVISGMKNFLINNICILQIESFPESLPLLTQTMAQLSYKKLKTIKNDHYFSNE